MDRDTFVVERQIGRPPRGTVRVAARCAFGYPTVVAVDPFVDAEKPGRTAEPFPTRYWLTCPVLREQVSRLESGGLLRRLDREIAADPALCEAVDADHDRYAAERYAGMDAAARARAAATGVEPVLRDTGVGGVRRRGRLKCLHAHYAHHLVSGNTVGALLDERYELRECPANDVRCRAFEPESATDADGGS